MRGQSISYFLYIYLFILYIYIFILYIYYYSIQVNESQDQVVPNSDEYECQVESNNETLVHDEDEVSQEILQHLIVSISKCKKIDLVLIT